MKTRDILYRQSLVGFFFVLWGILWLAMYHENLLGKLLSGFFMIFGLFILIKNYFKFKKADNKEILIYERTEMNVLRASKIGFLFMFQATGLLLALVGLKLINEILFVAFMGPVFAIGSLLYVRAYHRYEKGGDENQD